MNRMFFYLIGILLLYATAILGQDSTVTIVGPGFKYHSVYKTIGPNNIKIFEIDLTNPKNKLKTVLSKDLLGTGFEKTSSMSKRKSQSGHIVMGAVNGDFYGISAPYNPYTFLVGSMISEKEYTFGRSSLRPLFGIREDKKLFIDDMGLAGTVTSSNGNSFTLTSINDTVITNYLVLYNRYFGSSTLSNNQVTEVKLKPITNFNINSEQKFLVLLKTTNTGNMSFNSSEYVLSGSGSAKTFLTDNVNIGDTVRVTIGTSPNRGAIAHLIGGGPKLVVNGTVQGGLGTDVHPRTAVGFNQDSTKLFFVTVDGRQTGFSVGMSLPQLANYILSIGCYQAVNLDGGGSTTMVVRNEVVNSPSDAGGERSVANALLAVCEVSSTEILDSFYLQPKQIYIDSSQSKKININGKDLWGYQIEISPKDVTWQIVGISGNLDTLGFFHPGSIGSGLIIGRVGTKSDTISVTVTGAKIPVWSFSAGGGNLPTWLSPTVSTERGLVYAQKNGNHRLYVVNRPNALILDASTGDQVGSLNVSGISGGTFTLNDIEVSDDGMIFGANLTVNASTDPFKIYKWNDESSTPVQVLTYSGGAYRLGDKFTVVGSLNDNSAIIYAAVASSNKVLKWTMSGGNFISTPIEITLSGVTNVGTSPAVYPRGLGSTNFFVNGNSITPREFTSGGGAVATIPSSVVDSRSSSLRYLEAFGKKFLITYQYGFPNENAKVLDITNGSANAVVYETTPSLGTNVNTVGTSGDVAYRYYGNGVYIIYVLATNNGIAAHQINIDTLTSVETPPEQKPHSFFLHQNYPNPFNPNTRIQYSVLSNQHVKLKVYDILGRVVATLVDEVKEPGIYNSTFSTQNSALPTGIYFYQLKAGDFTSTKKMTILK